MGKYRDRDRDPSPSSSGSESDSDDDRSRKDSKKDPKKDSKKSKKHKKEKRSHKKARKHEDAERELVKKAKEFLKSQLAYGAAGNVAAGGGSSMMPPPPPRPPAPVGGSGGAHGITHITDDIRITETDYFRKSTEFVAWLQEERRQYFGELSTDDTRRYFAEFVEVWNTGRLHPKYYAGNVMAPTKRTSHQWAFNKAEGGASGSTRAEDDRRVIEQLERKRWRAEQKETLDDLLPKATGREAIAEKRAIRREDAKARESSPDQSFLPGGGSMMGGDESFAAAKAREAQRAQMLQSRRTVKQDEVAVRVAAAQAKEDEKMASFRALLAQGPITIAKRT